MTGTMARRAQATTVAALFVLAGLFTLASEAEARRRPKCFGKRATIVSKKRVVKGTNKADVIVGRKRSQRIYGRGGNDLICGGGGKDRIYGGSGNDRIDGGKGSDLCYQQGGTGSFRSCAGPKRTLTVATDGSGAGAVASAPAGISCGVNCSRSYLDGYNVSLTPSPDPGSVFAGWDGACAGTGTCVVNMSASKSVTATFVPEGSDLVVTVSGTGSGVVSSVPLGIDCGADCSETFDTGTEVTLSATPDIGSDFAGWDGDCLSEPCVVTMDQDRAVTATFAIQQRTLMASVSGSGTVSSSPPGIDCGLDCTEDLDYGTVVDLTATPDPGWALSTWSGDCTGTGACQVTMDQARDVTATFVQVFTLNVTAAGSGSVSSDPAGIDCGLDCAQDYETATVVDLTATPAPGWVLSEWSGDCSGTGACQVTMDQARDVTATFIEVFTLDVSTIGSGSVSSDPPGIDCGLDCTEDHPDGTVVELTATPAAGWVFGSWDGCDSEADAVCTMTVDQDEDVTATFLEVFTLNVNTSGSGSVSSAPVGIDCGLDCTEDHPDGTSVELTAAPAAGWVFDSWDGCDSEAEAVCTMTVDQDESVTATFLELFTLNVSVTGSGSVSSDVGSISCLPTCTDDYADGTAVTLTATPAAGFVFSGWTEDCSGTGTCALTMDQDHAATATFLELFTLDVTVNGSGAVTSDVGSISCPGTCTDDYADGTAVTLTATPAAGFVFDGWSDDCSGTGTCALTLDQDHAATATFLELFTLNTTVVGSGTVSSDPAGIDCGLDCTEDYADGTAVELTATPAAGFVFSGWTEDCSGTGTCALTMDQDHAATATFLELFTLNTTVVGSGTVTSDVGSISCLPTCTQDYADGAAVELTATPGAGFVFSGWTEDCSGTGTCALTMDQDHIATATFLEIFTLDVSTVGSGSVSSDPVGIDCGLDCTEDHPDGTSVVLTATPDAGWVFGSWDGCDSDAGATCTMDVDQDENVTATFLELFTLNVNVTGSGSVSSDPAGISCEADCTEEFADGTEVTLTADPDLGFALSGWSGDCSGTGTCVVTMDQDHTVTATFVDSFTLNVSTVGSGSVSSSPVGIDCGADCTEDYTTGTEVTLTATPGTGYDFSTWSGEGCAGTGTCVVTMDQARSVTATFTIQVHTLTVTKDGSGTGTVTSDLAGIDCGSDCSEGYDHGTEVTLSAIPGANSLFDGWSGEGCSGTETCVVTMDQARNVTATFALETRTLTVTPAGTGAGTVTSDPAGIDCGATCSAGFDHGTEVTLTATGDATSIFTGWSGDCSGTGTCVVTMDQARNATATFTRLTLSLTKSSMGSVTSSPAGIDCGTNCTAQSADFGPNVEVTLTASGRTPLIGSYTWGGDCSGSSTTCVVTMSQARSVTITIT